MKTVRVFLLATLAIALGWGVIGQIGHVSASAKVARIVADDAVIGQTSDVATVSSVTVPGGGANYRVAALSAVTSGAGNSGQIHLDYTDDVGAQTVVISMSTDPTFSATSSTLSIHAASGTVVVSAFCTQNACAGAGAHTYNLYSVIEEL